MAVIGLGNALTDILINLPDESLLARTGMERGGMYLIDLDKHNEMDAALRSFPRTYVAGGSAANAVNGVARLGVPAAFMGQIGADTTGEAFRANQLLQGVEPRLGVSETTPSGKCISLVLPDGERTMMTYLGASLEIDLNGLTPEHFAGYRVLFVEGYLLNCPGVIEPAMRAAKDQSVLVALDAASFTVMEQHLEFAEQMIDRYVDILFANEDEARVLTGCDDPAEALERLAARCDTVVVKVGPKGSMIARGDDRYRIGTIDATPIDKTGAGDLYAAGFLAGFCRGLDLKKCGDIGAVVSSKSVEVMGAQIPDDVWTEILQLVKRIEAGEEIVSVEE